MSYKGGKYIWHNNQMIDWNEAKDRGKVTIDCQSLDQMTNFLAQLGIR